MIRHRVEIRSQGGIIYRGVVKAIESADGAGELFELGSNEHPEYQRFVYVADRRDQIRAIDRAARRLAVRSTLSHKDRNDCRFIRLMDRTAEARQTPFRERL